MMTEQKNKTSFVMTKQRLMEFNEAKLQVAEKVGRRLTSDEFLHLLIHHAKDFPESLNEDVVVADMQMCNR